MADTIYLVTCGYYSEASRHNETETVAFHEKDDAQTYCGVRGADEVVELEVLTDTEARRLIDAEAKERRDEERFDRMRQGDL